MYNEQNQNLLKNSYQEMVSRIELKILFGGNGRNVSKAGFTVSSSLLELRDEYREVHHTILSTIRYALKFPQ